MGGESDKTPFLGPRGRFWLWLRFSGFSVFSGSRLFWLLVSGLFVGLTILLFRPYSIAPSRLVMDGGDPLLNIWIMEWWRHALLTQPTAVLDTNIFHPFLHTLAYSELLLPQALLAAPITVLSGNAVLGHNVVYLASIALTGILGTLLGIRLTGDRLASVVGACVMTFPTMRLEQTASVKLQSTAWIPLVFFLVHRVLDRGRIRDGIWLGVVTALLILSCIYYGLFLGILLPPFVLLGWVTHPKRAPGAWSALLIAGLIAVGVSFPVFWMYQTVFDRIGFRPDAYPIGGNLLSFFVISRYADIGRLLPSFLVGTHVYPHWQGVGTLVFVGLAFWAARRLWTMVPDRPGWRWATNGLAAGWMAAWVAVLTGVLDVSLWWLLGAGLLLGVLRWVPIAWGGATPDSGSCRPAAWTGCQRLGRWLAMLFRSSTERWALAYWVVAFLAALLTLGPRIRFEHLYLGDGPFYWLMKLPGYRSIRDAESCNAFIAFGVGVLVTITLTWLHRRVRGGAYVAVCLAALGFTVSQVYSTSLRHYRVKTAAQLPPVYRWLADQSPSIVLYELPDPEYPEPLEYLYASTVHWKKLVNGYSGHIPASAPLLRQNGLRAAERPFLETLRALGTTHLLVHVDRLQARGAPGERLVTELAGSANLELTHEVGAARVYRIRLGESSPPAVDGLEEMTPQRVSLRSWPEQIRFAGPPMDTRCWSLPGSNLDVRFDLGRPVRIDRLQFWTEQNPFLLDDVLGVEASLDNQHWVSISRPSIPAATLARFVERPGDGLRITMDLDPGLGRFFRLVSPRERPIGDWKMCGLSLSGLPAPLPVEGRASGTTLIPDGLRLTGQHWLAIGGTAIRASGLRVDAAGLPCLVDRAVLEITRPNAGPALLQLGALLDLGPGAGVSISAEGALRRSWSGASPGVWLVDPSVGSLLTVRLTRQRDDAEANAEVSGIPLTGVAWYSVAPRAHVRLSINRDPIERIDFWPMEGREPEARSWSKGASEIWVTGLLAGDQYRVTLELADTSRITELRLGSSPDQLQHPRLAPPEGVRVAEPLTVDPQGRIRVVIRAPTWCPAETIPGATDQRQLGISVRGVVLDRVAAP